MHAAPTFVDPTPCTSVASARSGIGLRSAHYRAFFDVLPTVGFVEVHSENFFAAGGQSLRMLERVRQDYAISLHGVGLSLGSADGVNAEHIAALKRLAHRIDPFLISDHVSWGGVEGCYLNDLAPLPYTEEALAVLSRNIEVVQDALGRPILVENPSAYLAYTHSTIEEWEFMAALATKVGCKILLDINNIYVSGINLNFDAQRYLNELPPHLVGQMHLAGHANIDGLLIDTHGTTVSDPVWDLYRQAISRFGDMPTLIEWDTDLPPFQVLLDQAQTADSLRAQTLMEAANACAA